MHKLQLQRCIKSKNVVFHSRYYSLANYLNKEVGRSLRHTALHLDFVEKLLSLLHSALREKGRNIISICVKSISKTDDPVLTLLSRDACFSLSVVRKSTLCIS